MSFMTKEEFERLPKKDHLSLYKCFCSSYLLNKKGGYHEAAEKHRQIMLEIKSFGKVSDEEAIYILGYTEAAHHYIEIWIDGIQRRALEQNGARA